MLVTLIFLLTDEGRGTDLYLGGNAKEFKKK